MFRRCLAATSLIAALAVASARPATAELLPLKHYTTQDGLVRDYVTWIVQDSRGFLWFGTAEGVSRFDGYGFTSFGREDGLRGQFVSSILESRDGTIWVATEECLARLDPAARISGGEPGRGPAPIFRCFAPEGRGELNARTLLESRDGSLWVGTFKGLFRFEPGAGKFETIDLGAAGTTEDQWQVNALVEEPSGDLWIATRYLGLVRRHPDGRTDRHLTPVIPPAGNIRALVSDGHGGLWAGGWDGAMHLTPRPDGGVAVDQRYTTPDGLSNDQVYAILRARDGRLAIATGLGVTLLAEIRGAPPKLVTIGGAQGLSIVKALALAEDRSGNLWIGSDGAGAYKLARDGFTTYTLADGLPALTTVAFTTDRRGRLYACTRTTGIEWAITRLDVPPFRTVRFNLPARVRQLGWGISQLALQDRHGEWWVPTSHGLFRFPATDSPDQLAAAAPRAVYASKEGLPSDDILRLFEDSRSDIWVAGGKTARFDRATGRFVRYEMIATAFGEDASGAVWIGVADGTLRRRRDGGFDTFTATDGVPVGSIQSIFTDSRGRLWIGSTDGGAARVDEPTAGRPTFVTYATAQGLSSRQVNCFAEDPWGRIYIGTGRGVDAIEPGTDRIRHFTRTDGLAGGEVLFAARDSDGGLWFGMQEGVSRLVPRAPEPQRDPFIFISEVSLAGARQPVNLLGETAIEGLVLAPDQHQIEIGFAGLDFTAGGKLRYQYRLEGADADWSAPTDRRAVNYAHLLPGRYRFAVRALDSDGQDSALPATISFVVMRPVWQRWWFLSLAAGSLAGLTYALFRYRVARLVELERIRTHIATDLHDDIGASLSQIAILNEVALTRLQATGGDATGLLSTAAQSARELVDAMSDVVWAVDPKRDRLEDLVLRMRRFAEGLCAARGIDLRFTAPADGARRIDARARRQVHLLFKESLNNAVKHSGCASIEAELSFDARGLQLRVADDGRGFDPGDVAEGNGLVSMRRRTESLGGTVRIRTGAGQGTEIRFTVPA